MSEIRRNGLGHELGISVDESALIDLHVPGEPDVFLTCDQLNEIVDRAPEIRRQVREAWNNLRGGR